MCQFEDAISFHSSTEAICPKNHVYFWLAGFTALGEMAMALAKVGAQSVMGPLLPRVADQIKEAISVKGRTRPNCPEALQCVGVLAQALGSTWRNEATSLVQPMMSTGLSQPLVKTLQVICLCCAHVL